MTGAVPPASFSHLGIFVFDLEVMTDFYTRVLGFDETDRGAARGRPLVFLSRDPNGALEDLRVFRMRLEAEPTVANLDPVDHGASWSLYFRDPEGNRVELFLDTPWYVGQPRIEPLDLDQSDESIMETTRRRIEGEPDFEPIGDWRARFEKKLAGRE